MYIISTERETSNEIIRVHIRRIGQHQWHPCAEDAGAEAMSGYEGQEQVLSQGKAFGEERMVTLLIFLVAIIVLGTFIQCLDWCLVVFIWIIKIAAILAFFVGLPILLLCVVC